MRQSCRSGTRWGWSDRSADSETVCVECPTRPERGKTVVMLMSFLVLPWVADLVKCCSGDCTFRAMGHAWTISINPLKGLLNRGVDSSIIKGRGPVTWDLPHTAMGGPLWSAVYFLRSTGLTRAVVWRSCSRGPSLHSNQWLLRGTLGSSCSNGECGIRIGRVDGFITQSGRKLKRHPILGRVFIWSPRKSREKIPVCLGTSYSVGNPAQKCHCDPYK
jgi:hypothetical protein